MKPTPSIRSILVDANPSIEELLVTVSERGESIARGSQAVTYRYPSAIQSLEAYRQYNKIASAEKIDREWFDEHHDTIAASIRLGLYDHGSAAQLLGAFIWIKKAVISEMLVTICNLMSGTDAVSPLVLIRSILENIGQVELLAGDLAKIFEPAHKTHGEKWEAVAQASVVITQRGKGTRIDWEAYLNQSLLEGKKKSYKQVDGEVDVEARDLLKGVDALDKKVKGARKAYELLSEFAHPNIGVHNLLISEAKRRELADGIALWERRYVLGTPTDGIQMMHRQFQEVLQILIASVDSFQEHLKCLQDIRLQMAAYVKSAVKRGMKNHPLAFNLREPCPCFSGKTVGNCCGVGIKKIHKKHGLA